MSDLLDAAKISYNIYDEAVKEIKELTNKLLDRKIEFLKMQMKHKPKEATRGFASWEAVNARYVGYLNAITSITKAIEYDSVSVKCLVHELLSDKSTLKEEEQFELVDYMTEQDKGASNG